MYVCVCQGITDRQIREAVQRGVASLSELQNDLPVGGCCGRCIPTTQEVIDEYLTQVNQRFQPSAA